MDNISVEIKNHNFSANLLRVLPFEDEKSVRIVLLAQFTSKQLGLLSNSIVDLWAMCAP
jgi:hypothetical protein